MSSEIHASIAYCIDENYRSLLGSAGASFSSSIGSTSANPDRRKNPGPS